MAGGRGRILLTQLGLVQDVCIRCGWRLISQGHGGKVCQGERRRSAEDLWSSAA